ncbi:protein of unknown function [Burkholderia multivorans]
MRLAHRAVSGRDAQDARRDPAVRAHVRHGRAGTDGSAGGQVPHQARRQRRMADVRRGRIVLRAGQEPLRDRSAGNARLRVQLPVSGSGFALVAMRGRGSRAGRRP